MQEPPMPSLRTEGATMAWLVKLSNPTWKPVADAVLDASSGVEAASTTCWGGACWQLNAATWSKAAMTLVDIARNEEAKASRAGKIATASHNYPILAGNAKAAWHASIAKAILPVIAAGLLGMTGATSAFAGDAGAGEQIFAGNCAACHAGGQNVIMPDRGLEQAALNEHGSANQASLIKQVTNVKDATPDFGGGLSDTDIHNVATYVITMAREGWD